MFMFGVLGPLSISRHAQAVDVGAPMLRRLLGLLLCHPGQPRSVDYLIDAMWESDPPASARKTLQVYVRRLRQTLGHGIIEHSPAGYLLQTRVAEVDAARFSDLSVRAHALRRTEPESAAELLASALGLWRGSAFADLAGIREIEPEAERLNEERLAAIEEHSEIELELGRCVEVIARLMPHAKAHPFRDGLQHHLILALYRAGRQAEALALYRRIRRLYVEELGVEPSLLLQRLHESMLCGDPSLVAAPAGSRVSKSTAAGTVLRKTIGALDLLPAQLPAAVWGFTGRAAVLQNLDALANRRAGLAAALVISVEGGAGVGKTATVLRWGHLVSDRFPDGQLYIDLRGYDAHRSVTPLEALAAFLRALGVGTERIPCDTDEAAALYRSAVANRRLLVFLDNARTVDQVRPLLAGGPGCLVVITSRERLTGLIARYGAQRITLDPLEPAESAELLARVLGQERVEAEARAVAELATACGHLPLALRIAAANLVDHPERSIASYVADLAMGDRLSALTVAGDESLAVRMAFDYSYASLVPEEKQLFHYVGLAPGLAIAPYAVAALAGCTDEVAQLRLDRLAAAHLLEPLGADRFIMHDLLRTYAQQRAMTAEPEAERVSALSRLLSLYLKNVDAAAELLYPSLLRLPSVRECASLHVDAAAALAWLDRERSNLVAAVTVGAQSGLTEMAWTLADAVRGYFWLRRHMVDWMTVAQTGLAAAASVDEPAGQCAAHLSLATAYLCQGRYDDAKLQYKQAAEQSQRAGWIDGEAAALGGLGTVCLQSGQPAQAAGNYLKALKINRRLGRTGSQAMNLSNLGLVYLDLGRVREAADSFLEALDLQRAAGSVSGQALALCNLGEANRILGSLEQARRQLTEALAMCQEIGYTAGEGVARGVLAAVERDAGRYDQAIQQGENALKFTREIGDRSSETEALNILGSIHSLAGRYAVAADLHSQALASAEERGATYQQVDALIGIAKVCVLRGALDDALTNACSAVEIAVRLGYRLLEARCRTLLAEINHNDGNPEQAVIEAELALNLHRRVGYVGGESQTRILLERLHEMET